MFRRLDSLRAVSLAHFSVDLLNSLGSVVLTFLSAHIMMLSKTQIGLAASLYSLTGSLSQPVFGLIADKDGGRRLAVRSMIWLPILLMTAYFVGAFTRSFELMLVFYMLAALGSGAFHPIGALHAGEANKDRAARNLSIFFLCGQLGLALGPVLVGWLLDQTLLDGSGGSLLPLLLFAPLVLPGLLSMRRALPEAEVYIAQHPRQAENTTQRSQPPLRIILFVALVIALRSFSTPGAAPFIPIIFADKGWTPESYGFATSLYWLATAISPVLVSVWAERFGSRAIISLTLLLGAPFFWLLPQADGAPAIVYALLAGGLTGASHSLIVAEGQRLMPLRKGFASGMTMGFLFGMGALGSLLIGSLSDTIGLRPTFEIIAIVTAVAAVLGWFLPETKPAQAVEPLVPSPSVAPTGD